MVYNYAIEKIQSCDDIATVRDIANSVNKNQVKNKKWLIKYLQPYLDMYTDCKILVAAGWHGLAAHFIDKNVVSFDSNPVCRQIKLFPNVKYETASIEDYDPSEFDIIICTSCEHITDNEINNVLRKKDKSTVVFLQSNNYNEIDEHINCKKSVNDFANSLKLSAYKKYTLSLDKYDRFMIIGK